VDEPHRGAEDEHVEHRLPPWTPRLRDGAPSLPGCAAAEGNRHQQERSGIVRQEIQHGASYAVLQGGQSGP
jgi:hypothetical protein